MWNNNNKIVIYKYIYTYIIYYIIIIIILLFVLLLVLFFDMIMWTESKTFLLLLWTISGKFYRKIKNFSRQSQASTGKFSFISVC